MQKLSEVEQYKAAVLQYADQIMETLLRVFGNQTCSVHEEAMLAVGAFTYACGRQFTKYLPSLYPYLKMGLMNHQEWQVGMLAGLLGRCCLVYQDVHDELQRWLAGTSACKWRRAYLVAARVPRRLL